MLNNFAVYSHTSVKPSRPEILAPPGEPQPTANGRLVIASANMSTSPADRIEETSHIQLTCQTRGGRPTPSIEWFRNGRQEARSSNISLGRNMGSHAGKAGSHAVLRNVMTEATLRLRRDNLNTGDRLVCVVRNEALLRAEQLEDRELRAEVIIEVNCNPD
ncbi:unnamed protein product [Protopolystoma xenopodis]|uniref:Ig-like domain-containing protein n=1 Tax=Protopolystoma xenopodis TaxID=117903 RepID=A0A448XEH9_9PLAT|nr:unnamed protein product [Protopolystoma xenopodis]